jgi:branched-chain amino acid transport system substrate-binding protein
VHTRSLALLPLVLLGCHGGVTAGVTFGAAGPWNQAYGAMNKRGIDLALEEINARPEWRAHPVRILFRNDEGDGVKATAVAKEFVDSLDVVAVVGHVNSGAMVSAALVYDKHLPAVATTASSPDLTGISRWTFRVISSDSVNGVDIARFATRLGHKRASILYENNPYGRGLTDAFRRSFAGEILTMDPIAEGGQQSFEPYVTFFKKRGPDVVFVAGTDGSGLAFLREARRQNLTADLVGGDGWSSLTTDTSGAEGIYVGAPFSAEDQRPEAKRFVAAFRRKFGSTPDGNAALAYDATQLLALAAQKAGADRIAIRDWLANLNETSAYRGVTGPIHFSAGGDPVGKGIVMTRIHRGALVVADAP